MYYYSVVVPVFNRPDEIDELLKSLTLQSYNEFEVIIVEDGSTIPSKDIVSKYHPLLTISYIEKENTGQGFSRNVGFKTGKGDYFIVFDSDCIIPPNYFECVDTFLTSSPLDAFGGPDRGHEDFTLVQKAISIAMTSILTTGGIRGRKRHVGVFHPRSFNMGLSRKVFEATGGFKITRMGEDLELSIRIIELGFKTGLIENAFVYHKRRTSLIQFFHQLHFFGRARVNVSRFYPKEIKLVHLLPAGFLLGLAMLFLSYFFMYPLFQIGTAILALYGILYFIEAFAKSGNLMVSIVALVAAFIQLSAYGLGFITEFVRKLIKK